MRIAGISLTIIGALVALVSVGAEAIGVSDDPGFQVGPRQAAGIVVGIVIALVGVVIVMRKRSS